MMVFFLFGYVCFVVVVCFFVCVVLFCFCSFVLGWGVLGCVFLFFRHAFFIIVLK